MATGKGSLSEDLIEAEGVGAVITVPKKDLQVCLTRLTGVITKKSTTPTLTCAAIQAVDGTVKVFGTDLNMWVESTLTEEGEFSCLVNHRQITALVKACPGDMVTLTTDDDDKVKISSGSFTAIIEQCDSGSASDIAMPEFKKHAHCLFNTKSLERAARFASQDETRYYLNGVHVSRADGAVHITSTDGHRLYRTESSSNLKTDIDAIIPTAAVRFISRYIINGTATIEFAETPNCRFSEDGVTMVSKLLDGTFPDASRVIPSGKVDGTIHVNLSELATAAMRVSVGSNRRYCSTKIKSNGGSVEVSHDGMSFMGNDEIPAETSGEPIETGFNPNYITDFSKIAPGQAELQMRGGNGNPFVIKAENSDDILVLMPMRLPS